MGKKVYHINKQPSTLRGCCRSVFQRKRALHSRTIRIGHGPVGIGGYNFPRNVVCNQKYNVFTFIPLVLFQQFKFFLNLYFLLMACSQFIPAIQIGAPITYWGPLGFVLTITLIREAFDDFVRFLRDRELNSEKYEKITFDGKMEVDSSTIEVGDLIIIEKDRRVPADVVLIRTTEKSGACFIRTDQLDGETDWKLRIAIPYMQNLNDDMQIMNLNCEIYAEKPQKDIHAFVGTYRINAEDCLHDGSVSVENVLWANTVLASGTAIGLVVYTGRETRAVMNTTLPESKVGLLDLEVNNLTKILFLFVVMLASVMVIMKGVDLNWYRYLMRFILLFSYIIPISLRVNLDMAKLFYSWQIGRDKAIPGTVVRSSTIPEELGRISFLLSDKTGTLTRNEMRFKKIHLGTVSFGSEAFSDVRMHVDSAYRGRLAKNSFSVKLQTAVEAIALCHNVTPIQEHDVVTYQAASPDEVALVQWTEQVGVKLANRDLTSMQLQLANGHAKSFQILHVFPFTSESKRMGIIVKDENSDEISLLMKGADSVMAQIVQYNDWLEEECSNMAREGLRTLIVAKKILTAEQLSDFERQYHEAKMTVTNRTEHMTAVVRRLENDLQLLCLTGVEDRLQDQVTTSLELLRNAGIKIWMLTGDKLETAICIAKSSGLFSKTDNVHVFGEVQNRTEAHNELNALRKKSDVALVMTGSALNVCLQHYEAEVAELVCLSTAVVCCRCSPEQKAQIVNLLKRYRKPLRVAAVGDGGNDVSMIQAAHAGIGIDAHEGKQASLAADFSITQFSHICRLLLVHGRFCYKRSCALSQFVMHRGLIISTMQAIFSCVFYFASVSLYQGILMVAYSTLYTMLPVFSLVVDRDVTAQNALTYPELYKELGKGRSLSYKTFCIWVMISLYQGAIIMYGALVAFDSDFIHVVSISFSALIVTELIMVAMTVHTWHWSMLVAQVLSLSLYAASLLILDKYFDRSFVLSWTFVFKTTTITLISCLPLYVIKFLRRKFSPPSYAKDVGVNAQMTILFATSCFVIAFFPSFVIFVQFVAKDPLRIILFVLGAFFTLLSLLISGFIWSLMLSNLILGLFLSIFIQEYFRAAYYFILHRTQSGLSKLAASSSGVHDTGVRLFYTSRHILAVVCGLGMGTMAALFLLLNPIADSSHDGSVGLPAVLNNLSNNLSVKLYLNDANYLIWYAGSCSILVLLNVCWTISLWDALHKYMNHMSKFWWIPLIFTFSCHTINSTLVNFSLSETQFGISHAQRTVLWTQWQNSQQKSLWYSTLSLFVFIAQLLLLFASIIYCGTLIRGRAFFNILSGRSETSI